MKYIYILFYVDKNEDKEYTRITPTKYLLLIKEIVLRIVERDNEHSSLEDVLKYIDLCNSMSFNGEYIREECGFF
jgi:hypothetical protein